MKGWPGTVAAMAWPARLSWAERDEDQRRLPTVAGRGKETVSYGQPCHWPLSNLLLIHMYYNMSNNRYARSRGDVGEMSLVDVGQHEWKQVSKRKRKAGASANKETNMCLSMMSSFAGKMRC